MAKIKGKINGDSFEIKETSGDNISFYSNNHELQESLKNMQIRAYDYMVKTTRLVAFSDSLYDAYIGLLQLEVDAPYDLEIKYVPKNLIPPGESEEGVKY